MSFFLSVPPASFYLAPFSCVLLPYSFVLPSYYCILIPASYFIIAFSCNFFLSQSSCLIFLFSSKALLFPIPSSYINISVSNLSLSFCHFLVFFFLTFSQNVNPPSFLHPPSCTPLPLKACLLPPAPVTFFPPPSFCTRLSASLQPLHSAFFLLPTSGPSYQYPLPNNLTASV